MGFTGFPEAVVNVYDRLHEDHQRTGNIPAKVKLGDRWYSLADCGPDELGHVKSCLIRMIHDGLKMYGEDPRPEWAKELGRMMFTADVASQLMEWSLEGNVPSLEEPDKNRLN